MQFRNTTKNSLFLLPLLILFVLSACDKDNVTKPDDDILEEEKLFLTVWEYDRFGNVDSKTGSFFEFYKRGNTGSALIYNQVEDEDFLFEYQIIPKDQSLHVYFSENGTTVNEKRFEYSMNNNKLTEIIVYHNGSQNAIFTFTYNGDALASVSQNGNLIIDDIDFDSKGNIIRISKNNGITPHYHFKICETNNPYKGMFRNFNLSNIYTESLFSIISFLNPNFVLDVASSSSIDFDWDSSSICISAEKDSKNYPHKIRERRYDTQGNMVLNKVIAEYEYH